MSNCSSVERTSVTSKPGKEKGMECNEKLLLKICIRFTFLYEYGGQRLSTGSAGEPVFRVLDKSKKDRFLNKFSGILRGKKNKAEMIGIRSSQSSPPVSQELAWMRLVLFYHKIGSISPIRPTLEKVKELDFAYLRAPRTSCCAATKQHQRYFTYP